MPDLICFDKENIIGGWHGNTYASKTWKTGRENSLKNLRTEFHNE